MQGKVEICGVNTSKLQTLSNAEMMQLIERSQQGDMEARSRLVEGNLKLVLSVVQRFLSRGENPDDLFQIGCIGLLKDAILSGRDLRADETLQKHADWAEALQGRYTFTPENTEQILQQEVGAVFMQVLEDAGVYKRTPAGQSAFLRFTASV